MTRGRVRTGGAVPAPARAARLTRALTAALALAAATFTVLGSGVAPALDARVPSWAVFAALAVLFGLSERLALFIEFRRQTYTITIAGISLVLGALLAPVGVVVCARILGAGAVLVHLRKSPAKLAYNLSSYACEAALDTVLIQHVIGSPANLDLRNELLVIGIAAAVDLFISF